MQVIIGEARNFSDGYDMNTESGVICRCGKTVIIKNKERKPITIIQCPNCGFQTQLLCGKFFENNTEE